MVLGYVVLAAVSVASLAVFVHWPVACVAIGAFASALLFLARDVLTTRRVQELSDGNLAEQFTSDEVRRLRRRGWRVVDRVEFEHGDVDHVVLGPGGVYAIETKWTSRPWHLEQGRFTNDFAMRAVRQSRRGRDRIYHLLRGNFGREMEVTAVLVVWGEGRPRLRAAATVDGVVVVDGPLLRQYLSELPHGLSAGTVSAATADVRQFVKDRDRHIAIAKRSVG
jgi:hypothetical protein